MNRSPTPRVDASSASTWSPPSRARRAADAEPLRVVLEREVELAPVRLRFRDWPGYAGPVVHVTSTDADSGLIADIARALAPRVRVLSVEPSHAAPAVHAAHVAELLDMFGFAAPVLIGDRVAALVADQHRVAGLVLTDGSHASCAAPLLRSTSIDVIAQFVTERSACS